MVANVLVLLLGAGFHIFVANYEPPPRVPSPPMTAAAEAELERVILPPGTRRVFATADQTVAQLLAQNHVDPLTVRAIESTGTVFYSGEPGGDPQGTSARIHWVPEEAPAILDYLTVKKGDELALAIEGSSVFPPHQAGEEHDLSARLPTVENLSWVLDVPIGHVPPIDHVLHVNVYEGFEVTKLRALVIVEDARAWMQAAMEAQHGWEPGFQLTRLRIDKVDQLPDAGHKSIYIAVISGTEIHLRIFDGDGIRVFDAGGEELRKNRYAEFARLKTGLTKHGGQFFNEREARICIVILSGAKCLERTDMVPPHHYPPRERRYGPRGQTEFVPSPDNRTISIVRTYYSD